MKKLLIKFPVIFACMFSLFCICGVVFSQTQNQTAELLSPEQVGQIVKESRHTLEDFGLSLESARGFTAEQLKKFLDLDTAEEYQQKIKDEVLKNATPEAKTEFEKSSSVSTPQEDLPFHGVVNCFDYYHFQSVQTTINASASNIDAGTIINFSGTINNQNDYPIVSGTLYVKIFKSKFPFSRSNGPEVVDQFVAKDNITIPAKGTVPVSFLWQVPSSLISGTYQIATFFVVDKKFNLLGLSFTDDIIGNTSDFRVQGQSSNVQFDKASVTIDNAPYYFAAFSPQKLSKDPAVISAKIDNTTNEDQTVKIDWNLYRWDSIDPANFIRTISKEVTIKAKSSKTIETTVNEADAPVYYLIATLNYKDSKSILNIRFIRPENNRIRLNFPSIMQFPIKKDVANTMFSCLHNSGQLDVVPGSKLVMQITDSKGKVVDEYTYTGDVTGAMMAVKDDFVSKKNLDHFFLSAQLWQGQNLVDQSTLEYDCNSIDPNLCFPESKLSFILLSVIASIIIVTIILFVIFFKKRKNA